MTVLLALIAIIAVLAIALVGIFNRFVKNKNTVQDAWSNIDVDLKRRHDLIPNLVNVVKGYASHEKETLTQVVEARNAAVSATENGDINDQIKAEGQLQQTLGKLFALREAYPD